MKKILVLLAMFVLVVSGGVAQAMRGQTADITKRVLDITENYSAPMRVANKDYAIKHHDACLAAHEALYTYLSNYRQIQDPRGYIIEFLPEDDRYVVHCVASIVALRIHALQDYLLAYEAYEKRDVERQNAMISECWELAQEADYKRREFYNKYGY